MPLTTTWPGQLKFAGQRPSCSAQSASTTASSSPMTAAMPPGLASAARSISWPRRRTMRSASAKSTAPVATSAENSPRLCPIATPNSKPSRRRMRNMPTDAASSAGCVKSVRLSLSMGP